jgi:peptidoglycan/xylan/chitin deacetylase (PgdA/CDA1 family)
MIGRITIKRALKRGSGWMAMTGAALTRVDRSVTQCSIMLYHRVAQIGFVDPQIDDWNVCPQRFEEQIAAIVEHAEVVRLADLPARLAAKDIPARPLACLTFDDGYVSVCTHALPVLQRYNVPATVFVVTSCVGSRDPMPFDSWSNKHSSHLPSDAWRPMNWKELETCLATGLVTIGSHSHRHLDARLQTPEQLQDEAELSRDVLTYRFGKEHATLYSYPYGSARLGHASPAYRNAVWGAGFQLAVSTELGVANRSSHPLLLPRIEAHAVDSPGIVRAKLRGSLAAYTLTDRLRHPERGK